MFYFRLVLYTILQIINSVYEGPQELILVSVKSFPLISLALNIKRTVDSSLKTVCINEIPFLSISNHKLLNV